MTTSKHTALPFGGPLTSAAMNAPLSQLDTAIVAEEAVRAAAVSAEAVTRAATVTSGDMALSARLDAIIIDSGTSDAETIDMRDWATVAGDRLRYLDYNSRFVRKVADKVMRMTAGGTGIDASLRILAIGDSVAGLKLVTVFPEITRAAPGGQECGVFGQSALPGITYNGDTGTVTAGTADYGVYFTGQFLSFTGGATRKFGYGGVSALWSEVTIYYVLEPGAGTFKVQIDGVDEGSTVDCANATVDVGIVKITRADALTAREIKVVNLTGTVRIIDVYLAAPATHQGVVWMTMAAGGLSLADAVSTATGRANTQAIIADLNPDVIFFEMKEDSAAIMAANLPTLLAMFAAAVPTADVVIVGSTPIASDDPDQVAQNSAARRLCQSGGAIYWDGYSPVYGYAALAALDWEGDGTHPATAASAFLGALMLDQLGWWAIPGMTSAQDVSVTSARVAGDLRLGFPSPSALGGTEAGRITPEPAYNIDVDFWVRRRLTFSGPNGDAQAQFALGSGDTSYLPNFTGITPTGPLLAASGTTLEVMATGSTFAPIAALSILMEETTDPAAAGNTGKLYTRDNGAGKTQLCVRFGTGAVQILATEP